MLTRLFLRCVTKLQKQSRQGENFFVLRAIFDSKKIAVAVFESLQPELNLRHEKNSFTKMKLDGFVLSIKIFSSEKNSLKASVNSYLKLFDLSVRTLGV